jgi:hypothetical protein
MVDSVPVPFFHAPVVPGFKLVLGGSQFVVPDSAHMPPHHDCVAFCHEHVRQSYRLVLPGYELVATGYMDVALGCVLVAPGYELVAFDYMHVAICYVHAPFFYVLVAILYVLVAFGYVLAAPGDEDVACKQIIFNQLDKNRHELIRSLAPRHFENSPALQCWVSSPQRSKSRRDESRFCRPVRDLVLRGAGFPALKRWAISKKPSCAEVRKQRDKHGTVSF